MAAPANHGLDNTTKKHLELGPIVLWALTVGRTWLIIWAISPMKSPIPCICNDSRKHHPTVISRIMQHEEQFS